MKELKIRKVLLSLVFMLVAFAIYKNVQANSISSISMDIYVNKNGDANVMEVWNCNTTQGTESYHPYFNLGNSKITNLSVSEKNKKYTYSGYWNVSDSMANKAYKCGLNNTSNGVEICWGISGYGTHSYTVKYTITNFVSTLSDAQMIYWTLIPKGFSNDIGDVHIKIHSDSYIQDSIGVWGYGKYGAPCYVADGSIEFQTVNTLKKNEYVTILAKFPLGTFNASNKLDYSFDYYYNMAEKGSVKYNGDGSSTSVFIDFFEFFEVVGGFLVLFGPVLFTIFIIFLTKISSGKNSSTLVFNRGEKREVKNAPYFRDIPCNGDIFRAYYIANEYGLIKKKTDLFGAVLLKWIKEKRLTLEKRKCNLLFKKEENVFILNKDEHLENELESELYKMMYTASKDGILEGKEFKHWCKTHNNRMLSWFDNVLKSYKLLLINEGLIEKNEVRVLGMSRIKRHCSTLKLKEEAMMLSGFKKYLKDYTLLNEREMIEVHLFEEYMVYAQVLGIAKRIAKQFEKVYPDVIEESSFDSYNSIIYIDTYTSRGISIARNEKARQDAINNASSYSSGGGGFSSGGGGGGSFGGGGSGRRIPLIPIYNLNYFRNLTLGFFSGIISLSKIYYYQIIRR